MKLHSPRDSGPSHGNGKGHPEVATKENPAPGAGPFGLAIFLVSLAVLFAASVVAFVALRFGADAWRATEPPPLPRTLWLSTALILAGSCTAEISLRAARANRQTALRGTLFATLILGVAFLASQTWSWLRLVQARTTLGTSLYGWLFYFLTGLHALHLIGGLVPLTVITVNAFYNRYSPVWHTPVRFSTMYWHFLGVVWLTLFAVLALGR
jgi:cytochrome c oxidase subunit 3